MKIRNGFVSNSSSSSFVITDINHIGIKKLIDYQENGKMYDNYRYEIDIENKMAIDVDDNAIWWICGEYLNVNIDEFLEEIYKN